MDVNFKDLNNTADTTDQFDKEDIEQNRVFAVFSYLSWLVLIPIFAAPKSKFARYHANQGLTLAIVEIAWFIIQGLCNTILRPLHLNFIVNICGSILGIAFLALFIIGLLNVVNGKAKELPIIGGIRLLK